MGNNDNSKRNSHTKKAGALYTSPPNPTNTKEGRRGFFLRSSALQGEKNGVVREAGSGRKIKNPVMATKDQVLRRNLSMAKL